MADLTPETYGKNNYPSPRQFLPFSPTIRVTNMPPSLRSVSLFCPAPVHTRPTRKSRVFGNVKIVSKTTHCFATRSVRFLHVIRNSRV